MLHKIAHLFEPGAKHENWRFARASPHWRAAWDSLEDCLSPRNESKDLVLVCVSFGAISCILVQDAIRCIRPIFNYLQFLAGKCKSTRTDFKSNDFVRAHSKGLTRPFFVRVHSKGVAGVDDRHKHFCASVRPNSHEALPTLPAGTLC